LHALCNHLDQKNESGSSCYRNLSPSCGLARSLVYPHCLHPHHKTVDDVVAAAAQVKLRYARGPVGLELPRTLFVVRSASEILRAFTAVLKGLAFDAFYIDIGAHMVSRVEG
jgi:hypothetical protein